MEKKLGQKRVARGEFVRKSRMIGQCRDNASISRWQLITTMREREGCKRAERSLQNKGHFGRTCLRMDCSFLRKSIRPMEHLVTAVEILITNCLLLILATRKAKMPNFA